MFKKIVVGLDSGETCEAVFSKALTLAKSTEAKLQLVGVIGPIDSLSPPILAASGQPYSSGLADKSVWSVYQDVYEDVARKEQTRLNNFAEKAQADGIDAEFVQRVGSPGKALCQQAQEIAADLIVVGSHGRTGLGEMLMGSVSNYVVHHAPCSVFVLRE
ncbi:MAG: universal stress protein [Cyanobacteria bacterium J06649_4]